MTRCTILAATAAGAALALTPAAHASDGRSGGTASLEPVLGSPVDRLHLIGASGSEIWGYGTLRGVPATGDDGTTPVALPDGAGPRPAVFVVYRPGEGWKVADEPRDIDGDPLPGFLPLGLTGDAQTGAGSVDAAGDLAVLGIDASGDAGLLVRTPGERFRLVPSPRVSGANRVLLPDVEPLLPAFEVPRATPEPTEAQVDLPAVDLPGAGATTADATTVSSTAAVEGGTPSTPATEAMGSDAAPTTPLEPVARRSADVAATTPPATPTPTTTPRAVAPAAPPSATPGGEALDARATGFGAELKATEDLTIAATPSAAARYSVLAVREPGGVAGALVGVFDTRSDTASTKRVESSIFHWDGTQWLREAVQFGGPTDPLSKGLRIVALGGSGLDDAWLLARGTAAAGGGVALFRREVGGVWKQRALGASPFGVAAPAGTGITGIAPLARPAQALTVGPAGVWVDGSFDFGGQTYPFTIYFDKTAAAITGSWCDAPVANVCLRPFGAALMTGGPGYRSFAWAGDGPYGQRVITNALRPGGTASRSARLALDGTTFTRVRGLGRGGDDAAFSDPSEGWLVTPTLGAGSALVHVTDAPEGSRLQNWPVPARRPLLAVTGEPGAEPGAADAQALAVGIDGTVARYVPGDGWRPEFLQNGEGVRQRPTLRGCAWPEANRAHAVGDDGAMWVWRSATGLWEPDASKPLDFFGNLMAVAFDPADPARGYAVGRQGTLLRYGKTWEQESVPDQVAGKDITSVTFAGRRAYAVFRDPGNGNDSGILVNDGHGWVLDEAAATVLAATRDAKLFAIHGLADGGVVAGGNGIVVERSDASAAWRLAPTPPTDLSVVAIRAIRESGTVRAVIAAYPRIPQGWPYPEVLPPSLPGESPQLLPAIQAPLYGTILREGRAGQWLDERHKELQAQAVAEGDDLPADNDQVYALELNDAGTQGWAVGGYVNRTDDLSDAAYENARRRAAAAFRYPADPNLTPSLGRTGVPLDTPRVRLAFGGHASCRAACADSANLGIAADVGLRAAIQAVGELRAAPYGPRAFVYSGPRLESGVLSGDEAERFAEVAQTASSSAALPFYAAAGPDAAGTGGTAYRRAFAGFPAPFGAGPTPLGVQPVDEAERATASAARNHYAFDSSGAGGTVRVIVVDNSGGSLAAADAPNIPAAQTQRAWLIDRLDEAKARKVPAIVVGNRDADALAPLGSNTADDARDFAQLLVDHGASAYLFDSPGINRTTRIPVGASRQIPQFGNGTIGRASAPPPNASVPYYGEAGYLMVEVDPTQTDPVTNIAPVAARLIPVLDELSIDPNDGVLLRRSKVTRWSALGRRPRMGDIDPYQAYPPANCQRIACPGRIEPEFTFTSSRPDIADFVQQDTRSLDDHAIRTDGNGRPIPAATSGLLCAYNGGTTEITIQAGGLTYSQRVTVQSGAVGPPCGTRPLANPPQSAGSGVTAPGIAPQDPAAPATSDPSSALPLSVPPPPPASAPAPPATPPTAQAAPVVEAGFLAAPVVPLVPTVSSLVPPSIARPLPPPGMTGVSQPVVEEKREEEEATESSQAYAVSRPHGEQRLIGAGGLLALILLATGAAGMAAGSRRRPRPHAARAPAHHTPVQPHSDSSSRRRRW